MATGFAAGSCSIAIKQSTRREPPHHDDTEESTFKRKKSNRNGVAVHATPTLKGKERQSPSSHGLAAAPSQLEELLRVAEAHLSSPHPKKRTAEITKREDVAPLDWDSFLGLGTTTPQASSQSSTSQYGITASTYPDFDNCKECIASFTYPAEGAEAECCLAPCPVVACSAVSPVAGSYCSPTAMACCLEPLHPLEAKPALIACQGVDCAEAAIVVCNDAECAAPSVESPASCCSLGVAEVPTACAACDDGLANSYSSFQELLDCWCCADSDIAPCESNDGSRCGNVSLACDACCIDESPPSIADRSAAETASSRATSISISSFHSPASSARNSLGSSSQHLATQKAYSRQLQGQHSSCTISGAHHHSESGTCLPPAMTLHNCITPHHTTPSFNAHTCHWAGCGLSCTSASELASHVNSVHLAGAASSDHLAPTQQQATPMLWDHEEQVLKCLWDSCHLQQGVPDASWQDGSLIRDHVLQAHVGFDKSSLSASGQVLRCKDEGYFFAKEEEAKFEEQVEHRCRWKGCSQSFADHEELTDHITKDHVGTGKASYRCEWQGCTRENPCFTQKQKILRHLQVHTGYRPFECEVCQKRFSESSTLAQHKRTHTKEKPYTCDTCGKSFAVAASLTIHKRIHTGEKPFACRWPGCSIAFSESSNLRKHMRIHTGERPFACSHAGCNKTFNRPDQLARHKKTHLVEGE